MNSILVSILISVAIIGCTFAISVPQFHSPVNQTWSNASTNSQFLMCNFFHESYGLSNTSLLGKYRKAAIAVDSKICPNVGKRILLQNGSAVDAAIATALCNGVVNSQSHGIGGGHFMLIYLREQKKVIAIDARETAPLKSFENMFQNGKQAGLTTGVPGEIAGFWLAHKMAGRLPWKKLFEPAISISRNGFSVSAALAAVLTRFEATILTTKSLREIFINPVTKNTYKVNEIIKMPKLANTLEIISEKGADAFYNGELSEKIVEEINMNGGIMTVEDLKSYKPAVREAVEIKLDNKFKFYTLPPPSSGVLIGFIMKIMSKYSFNPNSKESMELFYHRLIESIKHAYATRSQLGDINYVNVTMLLKNLTSDTSVDEIMKLIKDDMTFDPSYYGLVRPVVKDNGTAHLSLIAPNGDAVSMTSSVNSFLGAKYIGESTGILYNDQMNDFATPSANSTTGANFIQPGKRPMSSMSPIIVLDQSDNARLVLGAAGGIKIISGVAQVAAKNLFLDKNIKKAIDESRFHHKLESNIFEYERGFDEDIIRGLVRRGHKLGCTSNGGTVVQGVERRKNTNQQLWANSDYRKGGGVAGF